MTYQDELFQHLVAYKKRVLEVDEPGMFSYRGEDVPRDHILPLPHADLNLMPLARSLEAQHGLRARRHRYFHHLNSSQAFAYNLFLPYFSGGRDGSAALLRALGQAGSIQSWELEVVPDGVEGTNLDARWVGDNGTTTLCEVKLSEPDFGKAVDDERHRGKLALTYAPLLASHVPPDLLEPAAFFQRYQVLRNVWHLIREPASTLMFVMPRANGKLWEALQDILPHITLPLRDRIKAVAIEDALRLLMQDKQCPAHLREVAGQLQEKYIILPNNQLHSKG